MKNFLTHHKSHRGHNDQQNHHRSHGSRGHHGHRFHHDDDMQNPRHHQHHHGKGHPFHSDRDHHLLTRGRKLTSNELQLLILKQLDTQAAHGYELIKFFEDHSNGIYTPSPGVIYPALTFLHETDKVSVERQGNRKQYHITQEGKDFLEEFKEQASFLWEKLNSIGQHMNEVRDIFSERPMKTKQSFQLYEARRALKFALREKQNASEEELKRIEEILKKATAEILEPQPKRE